MSGLNDLGGIAARAYTPGVRPSQHAPVKSQTPENNRTTTPATGERGLAPAFSIELSLAAQKALGGPDEPISPAVKNAAPVEGAERSSPYGQVSEGSQFSEAVGRREAPLASDLRHIAPGSRLDIQI